MDSLPSKVLLAAKCPIFSCVMSSGLFEAGFGLIIIARALPSGLLGCGYFLVDPFCLGVKDAFFREVNRDEFESHLEAQDDTQMLVDVAPTRARKLIRDAVAYAADLGLAAAKDYRVVEAIFGDVDADACPEVFTFGKDGKPFYVAGPFDTPARVRAIARALQDCRGADGWDYLIEAPLDEQEVIELEASEVIVKDE